MEAAIMLRGSSAVSMVTTPFAPSAKVPTLGRRKLALESSVIGRPMAVPQLRRKHVMKMCVGDLGLAAGTKVAEIKAESEPPKSPTFTLLDLYQFICR